MSVQRIRYMHYMFMVLFGTMFVTPCVATVTFTNYWASFLLNSANSKLYVSNPAKITGWGQSSIVKTYGDNASSAWVEGYTNNSIVGNTGLAGVNEAAVTNLVDANSNAVKTLSGSPLLRTTSNLLLYTARTYSSSIVVLRQRSDSTNQTVRTTSNAVNLIYQNLAVPTTDSIDGTVFARYHTAHHVFHNNGNAWTIRGWVRFNNGFTVMPRASVLMDTLTTVSGGMDLRDTGTLILNNDLYLAHNVTLTNGGNIKGESSMTPGSQANTIFMGGDLTLASTTYARTLHITGDWSSNGNSGDLIIDGCGHTLEIGDRVQIFVDTNVTLTLRNMTIKTGPKSLNKPAIQLASHGSKLALDNVVFDLGADFHFITGQVFIHDEVAVTGTSAFVYQSPKPSYITSGATWSFETGTTFSIAPATYTDQPFTAGTATSNNIIVLADASSALSLSGCSLKTTFTGLRLRSGMVLFNDNVTIDTQAGVDLASTSTTPVGFVVGQQTGKNPYSVSWTPDSNFLAIVNYSSNTLQVFRFKGNNTLIQVGATIATGTLPYAAPWSPDGRFLALLTSGTLNTGAGGDTLQIYSFNGSSTLIPVGGAAATGINPFSVAWSPDGRFLAVINYTSNTLQVYRFNGISAPTTVGGTVATGNHPYIVYWSPDGKFLSVANGGANTIQVYQFNGNSTPTTLGSSVGTGARPDSASWSPDGRFLAVANADAATLQIYVFNGSGAPTPVGSTVGTGIIPQAAIWSPDGRFVAVAAYSSANLGIYRFSGSATPTLIGSAVSTTLNCESSAWSPDGRFVAVSGGQSATASPNNVQIFRCNFYYTGQPAQGFTNGLLFGDKAKGSAYDANVQVLGSATVSIKGRVRDDSA